MATSYNPKIVTTGMVLYLDAANRRSYPGSGTSWNDLIGNNTGTLTNSPTFSSNNLGNISFNGTNNYVDVANQENFNFANTTFTVGVWFKTANTNPVSTLISKGYINGGWLVYINTDTFAAANMASTGATVISRISSVSVNNNVWRYGVAVINTSTTVSANNTVDLYVDGEPSQGTEFRFSGVYSTTSTTLQMGRRSTPDWLYPGNIASVQIYNRGLNFAEILQNFNATRGRFGV